MGDEEKKVGLLSARNNAAASVAEAAAARMRYTSGHSTSKVHHRRGNPAMGGCP